MDMENGQMISKSTAEIERAAFWLRGYKNHIMIKLYPERKPYLNYVNYANTCKLNALNSYKVACR